MFKMNRIFIRENLQIVLVIFIIAGAVILSRFFVNSRTLPETATDTSPVPVTVTDLIIGAYPIEFRTTGRVLPRSTVSISPQVAGRVEWIDQELYSGGFLQRNKVLFRIETADYENDVARERAAVAKARTGLALENAEAIAAVAEWQALNEGIEAPPLVSREPQIAQVEAELAAARARLAQAELNLARTQYRLPFDGRVMTSTLSVGQYVSIGQSYGEIYDLESLEIVLSMSPDDLSWLDKPEQVVVSIQSGNSGNGDKNRQITGKILRVGAALDDTTRFQQIVIKPVDDGRLLPGMLTDVVLQSPPVPDIWQIPTTAIQPGAFVWIVDQDSMIRRLKPEIIASLADTEYARLPIAAQRIRIVDTTLNGVKEGVSVVVVNEDADESSL